MISVVFSFYCILRSGSTGIEYTLCLKNDSDIAHYNFNAHRPISLIFGTDIAE